MIANNVWILAIGENGNLLLNDIEIFTCMRKETYQIKPSLKDHQRLTNETHICETYLFRASADRNQILCAFFFVFCFLFFVFFYNNL